MQVTVTKRAEEALAEMLVGDAVAKDLVEQALLEKRFRDAERAAIQEGIDDMRAGRMRPFEGFDAEFRREHGVFDRA